MNYKTELLEELSPGNITDKIDEKIQEMSCKGYELLTMSFYGTQRAVLVFRKGLKKSFT